MAAEWKAWNRDVIDKMYSPSMWSTRYSSDVIVQHHKDVVEKATMEAQASLHTELGIQYDAVSKQTIDIYHSSDKRDSDVVIYFHGGYWKAFGIEHSGFLAHQLCSHGFTLVAVGYDLAPKVDMTTIVKQCTLACCKVFTTFPKARVYLAGHSSGAHLAMCVAAIDWGKYGHAKRTFEGALLFSGVYDLQPIKLCYVNDPLNLTDFEVQQFSPQSRLSFLNLSKSFRSLIVAGEDDTPEFKRQAQEYHKGLLGVGVESELHVLKGEDHFSLIERLVESDYTLTKVMLKFLHVSKK